ncbi:MAG: arsenosugar biosynthesis radical SAM (seleno)protein ArsS [Vicinamibacterales bacterium]
MALPTLLNRHHALAPAEEQRRLLDGVATPRAFEALVADAGHDPLRATDIGVLQINLGKRCNQVCRHCHVDAGPDRTEVMPDAVVDRCLALLGESAITTLDITGGAPELHPRFRSIVTRARTLGRHVMDRCNLTITQLPNYADLPEFLAANQVEVVASLPSYNPQQTDTQRGDGVFVESIEALRRFNALGYGRDGTGLALNLVTNPVGAFLPAGQRSLEATWRRELKRRYDIEFNRLYTITNMPISRFLEFLLSSGNLDAYMSRLVNAFNPAAIDGLMCRSTLSVGWDGTLYDCDFNQMLDLGVHGSAPRTIFDATVQALATRPVVTGPHCFGCTAGSGSSCGGATVTA